jgi:sulfate permease, SulP family
MGEDTFSTVLVAFSLSTICVGIFFYLLGHFELGNAVYFFPRHVIVGCIGGIGVFLFITGIEGSTNRTWTWNLEIISTFFSVEIFPLWFGSFCFEIFLRILAIRIKEPLLAPFYFVSIPIVFYIILLCGGISVNETHNRGWFFEGSTENTDFLLIWKLIDFKSVNWQSIFKAVPTTMALTVFSLMHVPVRITVFFIFISILIVLFI